MLVKGTPHDELMLALCLGSFPLAVSAFVDSRDFFSQTVFVDYKVHLQIQQDLNGSGGPERTQALADLIEHASSFNANYAESSKSYSEVLYYTVVMAHLHYLSGSYENMYSTLTYVKPKDDFGDSLAEKEFVQYLNARYVALLGSSKVPAAQNYWIDYLVSLKKYGLKSQIAANRWNDTIFSGLLYEFSSSGAQPLQFSELANQPFARNPSSLVAFANYCLRADHEKYILSSFRDEYTDYLTTLLNKHISQNLDFPNASSENSAQIDFVDSLYESLYGNKVNTRGPKKVLSSKLSKKYLINLMGKTYQSFTILSNYIKTLVDLGEFDEAFAAFKTYINYIEKDQQQRLGFVDNILEITDVYATCIQNFNPGHYMFHDGRDSHKRFKHNSVSTVVETLKQFETQLVSYLDKLAHTAGLSYDNDNQELQQNRLSFLYHKYTSNIVSNDSSKLISTVSRAWFVLGNFHSYLASIESPKLDIMHENAAKLLRYYKNALIINPTGSLKYLFRYALELAYHGEVDSAIKLSKFILKRYPESFRTWNLLVLLVSAVENETAMEDKAPPPKPDNGAVLDGLQENGTTTTKVAGLEQFIEDALNIAALYLTKRSRSRAPVSLQTKYSIIQLKMTQLAVWECNHGLEYILEYIPEVFVLYRQLFGEGEEYGLAKLTSRVDEKWSHRPSVIDPTDTMVNGDVKEHHNTLLEKSKRLSRIGTHETRNGHKEKSATPSKPSSGSEESSDEARLLQQIWLWSASIYMRIGHQKEAEECITEAETVAKPSVHSHTCLGLLTSKARKFLSLQEFERSLESFSSPEKRFNKRSYATTLLGLCKLFIVDDETENSSLFISAKDYNSGLIRLKNYLEEFCTCWPYGYNSVEVWYYLSIIYERFDDKLLLNDALWKCVDLEKKKPVRDYSVCEEWW